MSSSASKQFSAAPAMQIDPSKQYTATLDTSLGTMKADLFASDAPLTVNNFVFLAQNHFYDGLTFHRYVPGFVIQGGDPAGNGTGGLGYKLPNETNPSSWPAGSLGMASNAAGVSGCQFFVVLAPAPSLATSGVYNHFGAVHSGMDVVQQLRQGDTIKGIDVAAS